MRRSLATVVILLTGIPAGAATLLEFEGFENFEAINDFYAGDVNAAGVQGPDFGISMRNGFAFEVDGNGFMSFDSGFTGEPRITVEDGFENSITFRFAALFAFDHTLWIQIRGENSTILATQSFFLPAWQGGPPVWMDGAVAFSGTAFEVRMSDSSSSPYIVGIDDLAFGRVVPLPGALWLFASAGGALAGVRLFRRRQN